MKVTEVVTGYCLVGPMRSLVGSEKSGPAGDCSGPWLVEGSGEGGSQISKEEKGFC